ncbi:MAG: M1 family aminopeptidase [Minicystis sp.]
MQLSRFLAAPVAAAIFSAFLPACGHSVADPGSAAYDVERYDLTGTYDWARGRLVATVRIKLAATGPDLTQVVLDSAVTQVRSVRADGIEVPFSVDEEQRKLVIDVGDVAGRQPGEPMTIQVDYEAASGRGLTAIPVRAGNPVASRTLYTNSEPTGAPRWMPCHDRTDDRAIFSVDLTVGDDESVIANGNLELDARDAALGHHMRYETRYPLPTYLMAFAVGDFEVEHGSKGGVPLAVWHRRGVPGAYGKLLAEIGREVGLFSDRLGPYPFEKYALVMLPEFPGGMENAGITFQSEAGSAQPSLSSDIGLDAHELGHQWYGDLITVASWDDLWIKEGMATLLSAEAERLYLDEGNAGTLLGDSFRPADGAAVRDSSLAPGDKYTSGPYARGAWLYTQIRAVVGEDAFWGTLRRMIEEHRFGTISTDDLLNAFAPALGPQAAARARKAVDAKALPRIEITKAPSGGAAITLHDPEGILVAPLSLEWHRENGALQRETLVPNLPHELRREAAGDFLVLDPGDVHPAIDTFFADDETGARFDELVAPLYAPLSAAAAPRFADLPGAHALAALEGGAMPKVAPEDLAGFIASLDSAAARAVSIEVACSTASAAEALDTKLAWTAALTDVLKSPPVYGGLGYVDSYDACATVADPLSLFASDWAELAKGLTTETVSEPRLAFLTKFTLPPAAALAVWGNVVENGYSLRARTTAARQLKRHAASLDALTPAEVDAFRTRVADLIGGSEVSSVLAQLIQTAVSLKAETASDNASALAALTAVLRSPATQTVQPLAICAAAALTADDSDAYRAFADGLAGAPLSQSATDLLADPAACED